MIPAAIVMIPSWTGAGRAADPDALVGLAALSWPCSVETVSTNPAAVHDGELDDYARHPGLDRVCVVAEQVARHALCHLRGGRLPIAIGGDHTLTIGGFAGLRSALGPAASIGLVWIDAHADLNTHETTQTHRSHGMPLAALAGLGHPALVHAGGVRGAKLRLADIALVGLRSVDPPERALLDRHPELLAIDAEDIAEHGLDHTIVRLVAWAERFEAVYLSFDLDAICSTDAPGVTTPVPYAGLAGDEAVALVEQLAAALPIRAADFVEYWPAHDIGGRTARLIHDLVAELLQARAPERRGRSLGS